MEVNTIERTKNDFKKSLKAFLTDVEWTDSIDNRVNYLLDRLIENIPPKVIRKVEKVIVEKKVIVHVPTRKELQDRLTDTPKPDLHDIAKEVEKDFGIDLEGLRSKIRRREYVDARNAFILKALARYNFGVKELGRFINRDHTTICHHKNREII